MVFALKYGYVWYKDNEKKKEWKWKMEMTYFIIISNFLKKEKAFSVFKKSNLDNFLLLLFLLTSPIPYDYEAPNILIIVLGSGSFHILYNNKRVMFCLSRQS